MDIHIRFGTAHWRIARPPYPSCPHSGDEWGKLPPRHQQEGAAAIDSGEKPKSENAKRRRSHHQNINQYQSTEKNAGASQPFSLNPAGILSRRHLAQFVSVIDKNLKTLALRTLGPPSTRRCASFAEIAHDWISRFASKSNPYRD